MNSFSFLEEEGFNWSRHGEILRRIKDRPAGIREISRAVKVSVGSISRYVNQLESQDWGFVESYYANQRRMVQLTDKGRELCSYGQIRTELGYLGLKIAEEYHSKGYRVRFLKELTGLEGHDAWLFAWNPQTREVDLLKVFGVRSLKSKGELTYRGSYIDDPLHASKPLRQDELSSFVRKKIGNDWSEKKIGEALKEFWDVSTFNYYTCVFMPKEEFGFGFPPEIGSFDLAYIMGVGPQYVFPFINQISYLFAGFNLTENLQVRLTANVDLIKLRDFSKLSAAKMISPESVSDEEYEKKGIETFSPVLGVQITCKNWSEENGFCMKMKIPCVAQVNGRLDFSKCDILKYDLQQLNK